jgi:hypothetical protein
MPTPQRARTPPAAPRLARRAIVCLLGATSLLFACSEPPPRAPNPSRPLGERRAVEIILQAFHDERDEPVRGRPIALAPGVSLDVDVLAEGKKYGVAYVTASERATLGNAIPPRDPAMGDALQLVSGLGADADARVLVLNDGDYLYDDQVGDEHEETAVTAELKLRRDVRDFLVRAHTERWP